MTEVGEVVSDWAANLRGGEVGGDFALTLTLLTLRRGGEVTGNVLLIASGAASRQPEGLGGL